MLKDEEKGKLTAVKTKVEDENRVKSDSELNVGDIVYQDMDRKDGLTLNGQYDDRLKYFVIVGKNTKGDAMGICLINSNLDFYKNVPVMQSFQYILKAKDYKGILKKDSRLNCAELFKMNKRKSVAVRALLVGHLTAEDEKNVLALVASCGFINENDKRKYRLGQK